MKPNPPRGRDVTALIERAIFEQAQQCYISGATAKVQAELALTRLSIYHKPGYNRNWTWDYQAEARIRGGTPSIKQHDWDDAPEFRRDADADEPEGRPTFRDTGSVGIAPDIEDEPDVTVPVSHRVAPTHRLV